MEEPIPIHVQQVINGSKVTDHHALLPTKSMANADLAALPAGERNILRLIAARLLCAVGEPHCYAETTLTTICAGEEFTAKGKVVLSEGWKAVERKMLGELLSKQKEPAVLRCAGAEPVQRCRCRTERRSNVPAEAFHRGPSTSCDGNRQCKQYAGGCRASGHRHSSHPRRNY